MLHGDGEQIFVGSIGFIGSKVFSGGKCDPVRIV